MYALQHIMMQMYGHEFSNKHKQSHQQLNPMLLQLQNMNVTNIYIDA